jgi:hypothetical protein
MEGIKMEKENVEKKLREEWFKNHKAKLENL